VDRSNPGRRRSPVALAVVTVVIGIAAGLGGAAVVTVLHLVQHLAFGYGLGGDGPAPSFLEGVSASPPWRRVAALTACGVVAGGGWWALGRSGRRVVSIAEAVSASDAHLPVGVTLIDALLQVVTVALGSPLGREVAPREVGAVLAESIGRRAGLPPEDARVMIACGAGAGLAAVYNVPLGGALFVLEVLLRTILPAAVVPAVATSVIAALVGWIGQGDELQYRVPPLAVSASLLVWALVTGPLFGVAAHGFARLVAAARARAPRDGRRIAGCLVAFVVMGVVAIRFPEILGNGRGPAQLGFGGRLSLGLAATLFVLKLAASALSLRAGAHGGLLTPSLALGALMATVLGGLWSLAWPGAPPAAFAVVGGAAFLATSQRMPVTAVALVIEFTGVGHAMFFPVLLAVGGSAAAGVACGGWGKTDDGEGGPHEGGP
jgi:H+/Cl- antiporter ClcA